MKVDGGTGLATYKSVLDLQKDLANQILQMLPQNNNNIQNQQVKTPPPNPNGKISIYA